MRKPNILFVMADQLIPLLTEAYGHPVVQTPYIEQMAQEGITFDAAYTPDPLCGPARAAFTTGQYASRIGVYDNATPFKSDILTIPHYLGATGYDCVASGKLHYVGPDQLHGFNRRLTTDIYPEDYSWLQNRDPDKANDPQYQGGHALQYTGDSIHIGEWRSNLSYDEETQFRSLEYIRAKGLDKRRNPDYQPFFLFTSFHHPHDPFWSPQEFWDIYENAPIDLPEENTAAYSVLDRWLNQWHQVDKFDVQDPESLRKVRRAYYGLVTYIDQKLGELLNALEQHDLEEDTIVVFSSDHGDMLGEKGMVQKRTFYEWSARVPLIIRFPDGHQRGTRVAEPVSLLDLLPTFLDFASLEAPLMGDGKSLIPLIEGTETEPRIVFSESHAEGVYGTCFMLRTLQYKYVHIFYREGEDAQLFDMQSDPDEKVNLIDRTEYHDLVAELKARLLREFDPQAIERDIQESIRVRTRLKAWAERTKVSWDYTPVFDPKRRTWEQYLP
jgi:choline-sulfatase